MNQPGGYGGANLNYGYLDAQWDLNGAGGGYATDDISEFQNTYLPDTYGTIATFNSDNGTSYSAFSQVPAAAPGAALFGVFQAFRAWSVQQTYGQLTADVRNITSTPLYYYFGGGFGNATNYANNPDTFFQLAKQYNVTIIDDDASSQGLTLTFGSLARAYGVKMAQEWTAPPDNTQLAARAVSWISLYALGLPEGGGEDFFIHDGTEKDIVGFPIYTSWLSTLKGLSGTYPQQSAAVYIDFSQGYGNTSGGSLNNVEGDLANLWLDYQAGFTVVTSQEVKNGAVSLSQFKAILPLNGVDANLTAYKSAGGTVLTGPAQLTQYTTPYAEINAPQVGDLQTVPAVATSGTSASITLANITSGTTYDDPIAFSPAGLGLKTGNYYLVNAATGAALPQTQQSSGLICATADIGAATLAQWNVVAGTPPSGTASSGCPTTETGATSVTATAGQTSPGLQFLGVGQTNAGSDGNLTQITQGGETALETWTSSQSGAGDANVYLQLNPMSAVEAAADVTVQVTYWATAGQGFTVQYDTPSNAYQNGPTVSSPGTGTWTTATVQLTGAQFEEAQNGGADLRLNVTNASAPLIVQSVTMSVANSSSPTLSAAPTSLSFGSQAVGSTSGSKSVTVTNSGTASATVSGVSATGGFSQTNNCSSIAAGGSCTVNVAFAPSAAGAATGTLTVTSNACNSPTTVALSGTGTTATTNLALGAAMTASSTYSGFPASNANDGNTSTYWESQDGAGYPQTLTANLGSVQSLGSVTLDLPPSSAWSTRTETLSVLGSTNDSAWTTLVGSAGTPSTRRPGTPSPSACRPAPASQYLELDFTGNTGWSAAQVAEFEIFPGSGGGGSGSATLTASPSSESFGNENVGSTSSSQSVTISNSGSAAASMSSIGVTGPFGESNNCGTSLAAGASCTVGVTFAPTAAGAASGTLSVNSSAPNSPLTVALSGTGVTTNTDLALNAAVTASSYTQTYVPANAVDGNTSTYWEATNGAWPSTITVNLGSSQTLGSITVDLPPPAAWSTRTQTLSVLGSTNGTSFSTLVASATYTWNPSTGNTVTIPLPSGTKDQYVELSYTANNVQNGAQASEIEIFG